MAVLPYEEESFNRSAGILKDISDRKQREDELERQNRRLDEFASVVSHDLRNPLNVAEGNLTLLREEYESDRTDTIKISITRMDNLIDDLLQLACVGDQIRSIQPVDLTETATDCWQNVETAETTLQTEDGCTIQADRSRLIQLLENMFRNQLNTGGRESTSPLVGLRMSSVLKMMSQGFLKMSETMCLRQATQQQKTELGLYSQLWARSLRLMGGISMSRKVPMAGHSLRLLVS